MLIGKYLYHSGARGAIQRLTLSGGNAETIVWVGTHARWALSRQGLYVLDPDAKGGPTLEFLSMESKRRAWVRLPGDPESHVQAVGNLPFWSITLPPATASGNLNAVLGQCPDRRQTGQNLRRGCTFLRMEGDVDSNLGIAG